ncbi:MAG TPA: hypothetical protein VD866_09615 [Urbifossiella sp.]|nr:hypothetical protein [Urbifossiella sp.]
MIFVWRGWGPMALAVAAIAVASCGGLIEFHPLAANAAFGVSLLCGGLVCLRYGRRWNRGTGYHTLYWLPLEVWGWVYIVLGGLFGLLGAVALVMKAVGR